MIMTCEKTKLFNKALDEAGKIIWSSINDTVPVDPSIRRDLVKKAFDAAFSTGAIGMYIKEHGVPLPVPERIAQWMEGTIAKIVMLRTVENTVSKRILLTQLYNIQASATAALKDANEIKAKYRDSAERGNAPFPPDEIMRLLDRVKDAVDLGRLSPEHLEMKIFDKIASDLTLVREWVEVVLPFLKST
jgi:hypothetical protein